MYKSSKKNARGKRVGHASFYGNMAWQYGLQVAKYAFPLITLPYLTRVLEPEGYAVYAYVVAFMNFVQIIIEFGFNLSGTKQVVDCKGDPVRIGEVVGAVTQARLVLSLSMLAMVLIASGAISTMREHIFFVVLYYVAIVLKGLLPDFVFRGMERMGPLTTRYFVSRGAATVLTFMLVRSESDLVVIALLEIVSNLLALAWSVWSMKKVFGIGFSRVPMRDCLRNLKASAVFCFSNTSAIAFNGLPTLFIGLCVADQVQVAYWSLSMTAISAVQSLYSPIINSLYPHMLVKNDWGFVKKLAIIALPCVLAGTVAFACLSQMIMLVLGGEAYLEGAPVLLLASPVLFFSFFDMVFGWPVLGVLGKVEELTSTTVISAALFAGALVFMVVAGRFQVLCVAMIRTLAEAVLCALRLRLCWRYRKCLVSDRTGS